MAFGGLDIYPWLWSLVFREAHEQSQGVTGVTFSFPSRGSPEAGGDIQRGPPGCHHHHLYRVSSDAAA